MKNNYYAIGGESGDFDNYLITPVLFI
jgi:hypothetical protein